MENRQDKLNYYRDQISKRETEILNFKREAKVHVEALALIPAHKIVKQLGLKKGTILKPENLPEYLQGTQYRFEEVVCEQDPSDLLSPEKCRVYFILSGLSKEGRRLPTKKERVLVQYIKV
jgi:hypothetical protein